MYRHLPWIIVVRGVVVAMLIHFRQSAARIARDRASLVSRLPAASRSAPDYRASSARIGKTT